MWLNLLCTSTYVLYSLCLHEIINYASRYKGIILIHFFLDAIELIGLRTMDLLILVSRIMYHMRTGCLATVTLFLDTNHVASFMDGQVAMENKMARLGKYALVYHYLLLHTLM